MFQQLWPIHEIGGRRLDFTEQFLGLIIPMAALLVVAHTQWNEGVRFGRISFCPFGPCGMQAGLAPFRMVDMRVSKARPRIASGMPG